MTKAAWAKKASADPSYRMGMFGRAVVGDARAAGWCADHGMPLAAAGVGQNTAGGFIVPEELEGEIFAARTMAGVFRRNAFQKTMGSDKKSFPRRMVNGLSASFNIENAAATESNLAFDLMTLVAKKPTIFARIGTEVSEDETAGLGRFLADEIGWAFAKLEDDSGFNGTGNQSYGGIHGLCPELLTADRAASKAAAAAGHNTFQELDAGDLAGAQALLPEQYRDGAKWYCSAYGLAHLCRLGATAFGSRETPYGTFPIMQYGGSPIEITPALPGSGDLAGAVMLLYGNMRMSSVLGFRRQVELRTSEERYLEYDQVAVLGAERFDIASHNLGDATNPGAMIALVGTA